MVVAKRTGAPADERYAVRAAMKHLTFAFYTLALIAGTASIHQTILIFLRYKKTVIKHYGFFLLALYLFLIAFAIELYGRISGTAGSPALRNLVWIFQAAGGITYVFIAPYFYHSLMGIDMTKAKRIAFFAIDALVVTAALANVAFPALVATEVILNGVLFGMIAYGLVLIAANLGRIADRTLKQALLIFVILSIGFFPFLYLDALAGVMTSLSSLQRFEGFAQPLYFLVLNVLTIYFGLKYFNRPAYMAANEVTEFFCTQYGITPREREILPLLLEGTNSREIADTLFVSPKTVENHVYNIYQKLGVKNRVQLYQLLKSNTLE
jgi:DNA-binding CsgD family transcriptional regulator